MLFMCRFDQTEQAKLTAVVRLSYISIVVRLAISHESYNYEY